MRSIIGEGDAGGSEFYSASNFGIMGSQSLLHLGALSVRLSEGSLVLIATRSVRSNCLLFLVVVSIVVMSHPILYPVIVESVSGGQEQIVCGRSQ